MQVCLVHLVYLVLLPDSSVSCNDTLFILVFWEHRRFSCPVKLAGQSALLALLPFNFVNRRSYFSNLFMLGF